MVDVKCVFREVDAWKTQTYATRLVTWVPLLRLSGPLPTNSVPAWIYPKTVAVLYQGVRLAYKVQTESLYCSTLAKQPTPALSAATQATRK